VGWSMRPDMHRSLVIDALEMGLFQRRPPKGKLIFHSDRGSQYASDDFRHVLDQHGVQPSMSRKGNCWDTQSSILFERRPGLTRAGIGQAAFALTCRSYSGVLLALSSPASVT
jgi:putative transposase